MFCLKPTIEGDAAVRLSSWVLGHTRVFACRNIFVFQMFQKIFVISVKTGFEFCIKHCWDSGILLYWVSGIPTVCIGYLDTGVLGYWSTRVLGYWGYQGT